MPAVWPPREFRFSELPALDAVVVSHEHEDHFNIPSLHMLDRGIPILMSSRASFAAQAMLSEMGFRSVALAPGEVFSFGDLQIVPFSPDHLVSFNADEWDGMALLARDRANGGAFFTPVDVFPTKDMVARLVKALGDSAHFLTHMSEKLSWVDTGAAESLLTKKAEAESSQDEAQALDRLAMGAALAIEPGASVILSGDQIASLKFSTEFLWTVPERSRPERPLWRHHPDGEYGPASGVARLAEPEWREVEACLRELAQFLYGSLLYKRLYSLTVDTGALPQPKFVIVLRDQAGARGFEYDPGSCGFKPVPAAEAQRRYVCGVECWASDLAAARRGVFEPRILSLGHSRFWRPDKSMPDPFLHILWPFFHPQRWPQECLHAYRTQYAGVCQAESGILHGQAQARTAEVAAG